MRKTWAFDFDEKINIHVNGKVGDKVNLDMNYNTDATFDFDNKNMKLKYEGKEDEIIKLLEAGNISMSTPLALLLFILHSTDIIRNITYTYRQKCQKKRSRLTHIHIQT